MSQTREPTELTHRQLGWLLHSADTGAGWLPLSAREWAVEQGFVRRVRPGAWELTPRGRELVDIAVRAANAALAGDDRIACWHCGDVLEADPEPPRCERCPAVGNCDDANCSEPGCANEVPVRAEEQGMEWDPAPSNSGAPRGFGLDPRWQAFEVTHMLTSGFGVPDGYVVMSIARLPIAESLSFCKATGWLRAGSLVAVNAGLRERGSR